MHFISFTHRLFIHTASFREIKELRKSVHFRSSEHLLRTWALLDSPTIGSSERLSKRFPCRKIVTEEAGRLGGLQQLAWCENTFSAPQLEFGACCQKKILE